MYAAMYIFLHNSRAPRPITFVAGFTMRVYYSYVGSPTITIIVRC